MKKLLALLLISPLIFIASCGKTPEQKAEIAIISCNILEASLDTDASQRIKEINRARKELSEEPFLGKDEEIKKAIKYSLCKELVLNDELYEEFLETAIEEEKIAEEEAIEAARIAREKEEEEERQKIKEWAEENKKIIEKLTPLEFIKFSNFDNECYEDDPDSVGYNSKGKSYPLILCYRKNDFEGFEVTWEIKFKNGFTYVNTSDTIVLPYLTIYDFYLDDKTLIDLEYANSLKDHVDEVNIYVKGIETKYRENNNLLASEIRALSSIPLDILEFSFDETLGIKYQIYPSP